MEVDSGRKQEYEYKLTEGLSQMRAQNEEQIKLYKDNMESTYQTRVGRLHSLLLSVNSFNDVVDGITSQVFLPVLQEVKDGLFPLLGCDLKLLLFLLLT